MQNFKIAIAQINVTVGDVAGNAAKILSYYEQAVKKGAELVVFPELALIGYPPEDLILMPDFRATAMAALSDLAKATKGRAAMIIGSVWDNALVTSGADKHIYNAAVLMDDGRIEHIQPKTHLPNYGIFDEKRLFDSEQPEPSLWRGKKLGVMICEDVWHEEVPEELAREGAEILIAINASPFELGKAESRKKVAAQAVAKTKLPLIYVNLIGGQDDIVFDGGSFAMDAKGEVTTQLPWFEETISDVILGLEPRIHQNKMMDARVEPEHDKEKQLWGAMCLGLRDYVEKNNFPGVVLGISGGIDSAITAAVAVDALGKERVRGVLLPSPYSSKDSVEDAKELARNLGIESITIPITPGMQTFEEVLSPVFHDASWMENVSVGGNLQARLRGITLMSLSNQFGWLLLSTGNKSEIAVGYTTLYGDSCGGYNVLKDLYKTQIYALAKWRNSAPSLTLPLEGEGSSGKAAAGGGVIPQNSISKAPSAELKPGQKDEDNLPPYDMLDKILALHIEGRLSAEEIIREGFAADTVKKVLHLVRISEFKRRQSSPGVKLSSMLFGKDRRYPLTNKY